MQSRWAVSGGWPSAFDLDCSRAGEPRPLGLRRCRRRGRDGTATIGDDEVMMRGLLRRPAHPRASRTLIRPSTRGRRIFSCLRYATATSLWYWLVRESTLALARIS